ncbi:preprotein translocase subunit Tim44 [Candidatus Marinamargulisbacteria bacterium SCGC AAA071-K20]|nr:preprotein translocase subunit Tim44 [Candidatus Marinamargulisbacteria bacterium SCGC AAA071-K20]
MKHRHTISEYLLLKLEQLKVSHIFGVPGDFILGFNKNIENSPITFVNTCDEQGAGYASDAYARLHGFGVVCITYCVGGLKVTNTTAEAFAEKSPVLVISGSPGISEQKNNPMLHHKVNTFDTQKKIFDELTVASASITSPDTAFQEIDRVINAIIKYKQPGYIELPRDLVNVLGPKNYTPQPLDIEASDKDVLKEAIEESKALFQKAKHPVILAGVEIHRYNLQDSLNKLAEKYNIPIATTILGKSVISENRRLYAGVYMGSLASTSVQKFIEQSDCLLVLGAFMTDMNLGIFTGKFEKKSTIFSNFDRTSIGYHHYEQIYLKDYIRELTKSSLKKVTKVILPKKENIETTITMKDNKKITIKRLFEYLNTFIDKKMMVISDVGDSLFGSMALQTNARTEFMAPAYYASIGFAVPAAIGAQTASKESRPLVIVGDGAFQMTGQEIATIIRFNLNPIILLLNNKGYGTERPMMDGKFNDILNWKYHKLPEVYGEGLGIFVQTEGDLEKALLKAKNNTKTYSLLEIDLDKTDLSPALKRLTAELGSKI